MARTDLGLDAGRAKRTLRGDEIVSNPSMLTNHATAIEEPLSMIWPWLVSMGWHQGGWHMKRCVDRLLFPAK